MHANSFYTLIIANQKKSRKKFVKEMREKFKEKKPTTTNK